jgi:ParB/RepB/Spo0J family partition protein
MESRDRTTEIRALSELREHPEQRDLVGDIPDHELQELAESIRQHGMQHAVEVLPDGTIVAGHQRVRAAKLLGWTEIDVIVRHDLADADDLTVLAILVEDNLIRRQMDPVALARSYRYLAEIERNENYEDMGQAERGDIRDRIAARLGGRVSGRTLDRYERVLDTPRPVQDAVSRRQLPMGTALKIAELAEEEQQAIADQILAGVPPKQAARSYLQANETSADDACIVYRRLVASLRKGVDVLPAQVEDVAGTAPGDVVGLLDDAAGLIQQLREAEVAVRERVLDCDEFFDDGSDE